VPHSRIAPPSEMGEALRTEKLARGTTDEQSLALSLRTDSGSTHSMRARSMSWNSSTILSQSNRVTTNPATKALMLS
jgi:hypothetical protein